MRKLGGIEASARQANLAEHPPLFLVGAPRSGTSLVYRALCLHPDAAYISNWLRRSPARRALSLLNRVPRLVPGLRFKYWFGPESNAYRFGASRSVVERVFPAPVEGRPLFEACGIRDGTESPSPHQAASLRAAFGALARFGGGSTVVSKCIANNRSIPVLAEIFPEARFVSIVRDGRAVANSLSNVDWWAPGNLTLVVQ